MNFDFRLEEGNKTENRGRRRRVIVGLAVCVLVAIGLVAFWPGEKEPEYGGKELSEWLDGRASLGLSDGSADTKAIRAIGTNALPYLLKRVFPKIPRWKVQAFNASKKVCPPLAPIFYVDYQKRFQDGMHGFEMLGPGGAPAIPELVSIARGTNRYSPQTAIYVLGAIGDDAMPVIFDVLTNRQAYPLVPPKAVGGAIKPGSITDKGPVLKALTACLKSDDVQVRRNATMMLGDLVAEPDVTVPTLISLLDDGDAVVRINAIMALRGFRKTARPAAQSLLNILTSTEPGYTRDAITATLKEIAPDVLTNGVKDF